MTRSKIEHFSRRLDDALNEYCKDCDQCKDLKTDGTLHIGSCPDACRAVIMTAVIVAEVANIIANKAKEA